MAMDNVHSVQKPVFSTINLVIFEVIPHFTHDFGINFLTKIYCSIPIDIQSIKHKPPCGLKPYKIGSTCALRLFEMRSVFDNLFNPLDVVPLKV